MTKNKSSAEAEAINAKENVEEKNEKGGVCFSLPKTVVETLDEEAEKVDKTRSGYLRGVLTDLFKDTDTEEPAPNESELSALAKANEKLKKEVESIGKRLEKALKPKVQ